MIWSNGLDDDFDPKAFDIGEINDMLAEWRER